MADVPEPEPADVPWLPVELVSCALDDVLPCALAALLDVPDAELEDTGPPDDVAEEDATALEDVAVVEDAVVEELIVLLAPAAVEEVSALDAEAALEEEEPREDEPPTLSEELEPAGGAPPEDELPAVSTLGQAASNKESVNPQRFHPAMASPKLRRRFAIIPITLEGETVHLRGSFEGDGAVAVAALPT